MPQQLIDSHAHLDFETFDNDRPAVLERAKSVGVSTVITIGTTVESSKHAASLAEKHDMVFSTAGIHPHQVDSFDDADWPQLETLWASKKVVGVGETGLDYFYETSSRKGQKVMFERHLKTAKQLKYPVEHTSNFF